MYTSNPFRWIPRVFALGLIYSVQGCYQPEEAKQEQGQTLVASVEPSTVEAKDPRLSTAKAEDQLDNRAHYEQSALRPDHGILTEPSTVELLDALLWAATGDSPDRSALLAEISGSLVRQGVEALFDVTNALDELVRSPLSSDPNQPEFDELSALIDLLLNFDLPEVESIAVDLLNDGLPAQAVCKLAAYLETIHPGEYGQEIRFASENALITAGDSVPIPGQLFQLLGKTGDSATVVLLANMPLHRDAYASVALALIPDGSGLPSLESDARLFETGRDTMQGRLAIELLAQQAHQFREAAAVLLELADRALIPDDVWPHVLELVAGRWELTLAEPASGRMGTHTIYRPEGNQVIYRVARQQEDEYGAEHDRRLELLDSLQHMAPSLAGIHE